MKPAATSPPFPRSPSPAYSGREPSLPSPDELVSKVGAPWEHCACTSDSPCPSFRRNDTSIPSDDRLRLYDQPLTGVTKRSVRVEAWQLTPTEPPLTLTESLTVGGGGFEGFGCTVGEVTTGVGEGAGDVEVGVAGDDG